MHDVHTFSRLVLPPPAGTRTVWMLGFQRRLVRRCEWDTLWPKPGPLPQTSHTLATGISWDCSSHATSANARATRLGYPMVERYRQTDPTGAGSRDRIGTLNGRAGQLGRRRSAPLVCGRSGRDATPPARDRRAERLPGAGR